jgi:hypothetical protein
MKGLVMNKRILVIMALAVMQNCYAFDFLDDVYYYPSIASNDVAKEQIYGEWALKLAYILPKKVREGGQKVITIGGKTHGIQVMKSAEARFDSPKSKADIDPFVNKFGINQSSPKLCVNSFSRYCLIF